MSIKNVVVIGGGVLGSQIAYQTAYCGFNTSIWLRSESSVGRTRPKIDALYKTYGETLAKMNTPEGKSPLIWSNGLAKADSFDYAACVKANEDAYKNLKLELNLAETLKNADLVIESLAEDPNAKIEFYKMAAELLPEKTILVTNSSTMVPSTFAKYTGRPEKYLALHFANNIWKGNTAEIMNHADTDMKYYDEVVDFAKKINMVPLCLHKEQPGYILNTLLVPFLNSGMYLWAAGISDPATIDTTWRLATGSPVGPFQILDTVGVTTAYNIVSMKPDANDPNSVSGMIAAKLKAMMEAGKLGVATGEGFYSYK
ncbi:MAG: 3-hydroxyacyl-CoA dehydrogenase [Eubacteriaceae bacterium]|nr:3-hydroxyacyl-CoA dehydrogenase [Eubacteriaceae bacterium]